MESQDYPIVHFEAMVRLATALKALPAQILEHEYSGEVFGSWYLTFRHQGIVSQLTYDGREDQLLLRRSSDRKRPYCFGAELRVGSGTGIGFLGPDTIQEVCRAIAS